MQRTLTRPAKTPIVRTYKKTMFIVEANIRNYEEENELITFYIDAPENTRTLEIHLEQEEFNRIFLEGDRNRATFYTETEMEYPCELIESAKIKAIEAYKRMLAATYA